MAELAAQALSIISLVQHTNAFLDVTTSHLSTLHSPIEPLEELLSLSGLTNSLLQALETTRQRFDLKLDPQYSFLHPLTQDIQFALSQLNHLITSARETKIWETTNPSSTATWVYLCGSKESARRLRSRFFVEKYRVRVLIDVITWYALRFIEFRTTEEEREYQGLCERLPVMAERLAGVWRDYTPRLRELGSKLGESWNGGVDEREVKRQMRVQRDLQLKMMRQIPTQQIVSEPPRYESVPAQTQLVDEKQALRRAESCASCSPAHITTQDAAKYETYILRCTPPTSTIKTSTHILGLLLWTTRQHTPASHYIKHLPSTPAQICSFRDTSLSTYTRNGNEKKHQLNMRKHILNMPDDAQREIQKLIEGRENTGEGGREWDVVAFVERERRKINFSSTKKARWWQSKSRVSKKRDKRDLTEWVIVLRGQARDSENEKESALRQQQAQLAAMRNQKKRVMSREEAERKLDEMCRDLLKVQRIEEEESDDESSVDGETDDEEDEDEVMVKA